MNFEYVRKTYNVPAEYGRRVVVDGKPGFIVKDCGAQIGVAFDDRSAHSIAYCQMTRSQKRYQDYLDADCYESFREYLQELSRRRKAGAAA